MGEKTACAIKTGRFRGPFYALHIFIHSTRVLEMLHAAFMCHVVYTINIIFFGSEKFMHYSPWSIKLLLPLSALIDMSVEVIQIEIVKRFEGG